MKATALIILFIVAVICGPLATIWSTSMRVLSRWRE